MNISVKQMISKLILIYTIDLKNQKSVVSKLEWQLQAEKSKLEDAELKLSNCQSAQLNENLTEGEFLNL